MQKEVVLERLCWLDGGCERARRGYLYGQLCCVGGCGRKGWWRGLGTSLPQNCHGGPEGGGAQSRCSPALILCSGNTWGGRGSTVLLGTFVPSLETGEVGRACWGFGLDFWAPGSWQSGRWRWEGGAEGGAPGRLWPWGSWPARCSQFMGLSFPNSSSLAVGLPALVSTSVKRGDDARQTGMGNCRGIVLVAEGQLPLDSSGVRQVCRSASAGSSMSWGGSAEVCSTVGARGLAGGTQGLSQPGRGFVCWFQGIGWTGREQLEPGSRADRQGGEGGNVEVGRG